MPAPAAVDDGAGYIVDLSTTDVTHNPFVDSRSSTSFSSGLHSSTRRGLHRRKTSEQDPNRVAWLSTHSRSRTSPGLEATRHPLVGDLFSSGTSSSHQYGVTRPRLTMLTGDENENRAEASSSSLSKSLTLDEEDRLVLIHEVLPSDTLAGVSLRYGISMAELRKANQLWTSDPIHLRKVLHIPLNKASKLRYLNDQSPALTTAHNDAPTVPTTDTVPSMNIHRVPASRLSFFPPAPSVTESSAAMSSFTTLPRRPRIPHVMPLLDDPDSHASLPGPLSNISSLFTSMPSPREGIVSRLSLDSGGTSRTQSSDGPEHEMDEIPTRGSHAANIDRRSISSGPPQISPQTTTAIASAPKVQSLLPRTPATTPYVHHSNSKYVAEEDQTFTATPVIRTAQLEPSPNMELPTIGKKRSKPSTKMSHQQADSVR